MVPDGPFRTMSGDGVNGTIITINPNVVDECSLDSETHQFRSTRIDDDVWVLWARTRTSLDQQAVVDVDVPDRPVALVLQAQVSTLWTVRASNTTNVQTIIVTGKERQEVNATLVNVQDGTDPSIQIYDEMYRNTSFHGCTDCEVPELWAAIREEFGHSPFSYDYCETGNVFRYTTQLQPIALTATRPNTTLESYLELRDDVIREQEPTTAANLTYSIQSYHTTLQTTPVVMFAKRYSKQGSKNYTDVSVQVDIPNVPVVLVLTDHGSSRWNVTISSRTNVTELVVSGLSAQQLNLLDGSIVGSQILMDRTSDKTERALNCLFCTIMDADSWSRANYNVPLFAFDYAEGATQFSYQDVKTDAPTTAPSGALSSTPSTTSSSVPSGMTQPPAAPGSSDNSKDALTPTIHKGTQTPTLAPTVDKGATEPPFRPKTTYEPTAAGLSPESSSSNLNNNSGDSKTTTLLGVAIAAMLVLVMLVLWMMRRRKYQKGTVVVELETQHEDNDIT